jgi:glycosyltransferase involved in cell wall biosynthesis
MPPLISVVVTCFNRANTIERAIESICLQTYPNLEIIVVDDASTDASLAVIATLKDPRLTLIANPINKGVGGAKNVGIRAAKGDYIAFLDSDDEWLPEKLTKQLAFIGKGPKHICFSECFIQRADGRRFLRSYENFPSSLEAIASGQMYNFGSTLLAHRSCFESVGMIDEHLKRFEDRAWVLKYTLAHGDFTVVHEPLAIIHHSGWPPYQAVLSSCDHFWGLSLKFIQAPRYLALIQGSLEYERAVGALRAGHTFKAAQSILRIFMSYRVFIPVLWKRLSRKIKQWG